MINYRVYRYFLAGLLWVSAPLFAESDLVSELPVSKVSSATKQSQMSPKQALERLKAGNQRFITGTMIQRNYLAQAKASSYGQYPFAVVLNCMDSRSVPEFIFDQGLADLFTLRVAGNVLNKDILGSLEFATQVAGARLIVVLGHTGCGAVAGACEGVDLGHLDSVLNKIKPLVEPIQRESGIKNCHNADLINAIARQNAVFVAGLIRTQSPIIGSLIAKGEVGIVAGLHDIKSGKVTFIDETRWLVDK